MRDNIEISYTDMPGVNQYANVSFHGRGLGRGTFGSLMKLSFKDTSSVSADVLAGPVYESSVRALYDDPKALLVGKLAVFLSLGAIWYRTFDRYFLS